MDYNNLLNYEEFKILDNKNLNNPIIKHLNDNFIKIFLTDKGIEKVKDNNINYIKKSLLKNNFGILVKTGNK
jgi:hypothetical protein